jgi:prepilin-type N-terminal cleavage/methylation domain-containing protein
VRSRTGFTLIETLIVVVLLGLLVLIAFPRMSAALVRTELRGARTSMINLVAKARAAAAQSNRRTWVMFNGNSAYVLARPRQPTLAGSDADTVGSVQNLAELYKVTVTADAASIQFDPRGFGNGLAADPVTIVLARDGHSSTITIDGLGRVTK